MLRWQQGHPGDSHVSGSRMVGGSACLLAATRWALHGQMVNLHQSGFLSYWKGLTCINQKAISAQGLIHLPGGEMSPRLAQDKSFLHSWFAENPVWCSPSTGRAALDSFPGPAVPLPAKFPWKGHSAMPDRRQRGCVLNHWTTSRAADPDKQPSAPGSPSLAECPAR